MALPFYTLCKVRGDKHVSKYMPFDSQTLISLLAVDQPQLNWMGRYLNFIWLGKLVLIPFPLESIAKGTSLQIYNLAMHALNSRGKDSEAACSLMASFLLRNDQCSFMQQYIAHFHFNTLHLSTLNKLLKSQPIRIHSEILAYEPTNLLECKYWVKCLSKIATFEQSPRLVTDIIKRLMVKFESREPDLRLVVAKNIAKLFWLLSPESRSILVDIMLDDLLISPWTVIHSTLLTFGFMALERPLNDQTSTKVYKLLIQTLFMSKKSMNRVFGLDVRDASCFVVWSMSKSCEMGQWCHIWRYMQLVSKLDVDLNVQRAAQAALQEFIGRHPHWSSEFKMNLMNTVTIDEVIQLDHGMLDVLQWWCWERMFRNGGGDTTPEACDQLKTVIKYKEQDTVNKVMQMKDTGGGWKLYVIGHLFDCGAIREIPPPAHLQWNGFHEARGVMHYLNGRVRNGYEVENAIVFQINDEFNIQDEFNTYLKCVPVTEGLLRLCRERLGSLSVCQAIALNASLGLALRDDILQVMLSHESGTGACEIKRALVSACPVWDVISLGLDDYSKSEQGDVGSWVRFKSLDVMLSKVGDRTVPPTVLKKVIRLVGEPNVKVHSEALTLLRRVFKFTREYDVPCDDDDKSGALVKLGDAVAADSEVTVRINRSWVVDIPSRHFLECFWLYNEAFRDSKELSECFWRGVLVSLKTRAARSSVLAALIEAFKASGVGEHAPRAVRERMRILGMST